MIKRRGWIWRWAGAALVIGSVALLVYLFDFPDVSVLRTENPKKTAIMTLREDQARETKRKIPKHWTWVPLEQMSPHLVHAVLIAEDDMFYHHQGFDWEQIKRAVKINWEKRRYAYGGSTLTQQLARTLYLSPRKNLLRKAKEALITHQLERHLSKKRILEIYLNVVEWGRGVYGAEAAAQVYFEKSVADLTPDEAVALASVLPSPRRWNPTSEKGFMARRRTQLTERMRREGFWPEEELFLDETGLEEGSTEFMEVPSMDIPLMEAPSMEAPLGEPPATNAGCVQGGEPC